MREEIRLSVIIPGYNTSKACWRRCVESVRLACGLCDEIICVDDGSDIPIKEDWIGANCDGRIKLIRKENGGLASARNFAMDIMRGKFVTFVDSDDEVCDGAFEKGIFRLETTEADVVVYGVQTVWPKEGLCKTDCLPGRFCGRLLAKDILELSKANLFNYVWNKIYRVSFVNSENGKEERIRFQQNGMPCEDVIFNLDCISRNAKWVLSEFVGYVYYRTDGTLLSCYKPSNEDGLRLGANAWRRYSATLEEKEQVAFRPFSELSELSLLKAQWRNIWRPKSPYSLVSRFKWLKMHKEVCGNGVLCICFSFFKMYLFSFFRCYFYFRLVRRRHISKLYPSVEAWSAQT